MDWYLSTLREEITRSREMLATLEAGKIRMGEHAPGELGDPRPDAARVGASRRDP